ncbi:MAG: hypothetical protein U7123_10770 [Potamolinea sp.]
MIILEGDDFSPVISRQILAKSSSAQGSEEVHGKPSGTDLLL